MALFPVVLLLWAFPIMAAETTSYTYDTKGRMTGVQYANGATILYTYDKLGNRLSQVITPPTSAAAPAASTDSVTGVTATNATLNATVNANMADTSVTFEYGLTTQYGSTASATPNLVTGNATMPVSAIITGLTPYKTTYHYRVKAVNAVGTSIGDDLTFQTGNPMAQASVNFASTAGGTLSSTTPGFMCFVQICVGALTKGVNATITATPAAGSYLDSWSGCDAVNGNDCILFPNGDKTVSATFTSNQAPVYPVARVSAANTVYSATIQDALNAATSGDTIKMLAQGFSENLVFNKNNTAVSLKGGFVPGFVNNPSYTTLIGTLKISGGKLTVEKLALMSIGASTYTVTYIGNGSTGGSVPTDGNSYLQSAPVTVKANSGTLVRTGDTFTGWNTAANGSGIPYAASGSATFAMGAGNVTLYAQWTALPTYIVTYNSNGSTGGSVPTDGSSYLQSASVTVKPNSGTLIRTGDTFAGWNTAANGSGIPYAASGSATFLMGSANVTLYAQWTSLPTYSVTYSGNGSTGGSVPTDGSSYLQGASVTVTANSGTLVRTGYAFAGWNTAANGSGTSYAASGSATFLMGSANVTLYAQWTPVTLSSITVTPVNPAIVTASTQQLTADGTYSDGSTQNVTATATWNSSDPGKVTVIPSGLVTAVAPGTATVTATSGTVSGMTVVNVINPGAVDELAIRSLVTALKTKAEAHDAAGFLALFAPNYYHQGSDLTLFAAAIGDLSTIKLFEFTIINIVISGNYAIIIGTGTITFTDGSSLILAEPDAVNGFGLGWLTKTSNGWQVYGDQTNPFPAELVGMWQTSHSFYSFNADGTFTFGSIYEPGGQCLLTYKMEVVNEGIASVSGPTITFNITGGTVKTWNCTHPLDGSPNEIKAVSPRQETETWSISGNVLTLDDGKGNGSSIINYTKQ